MGTINPDEEKIKRIRKSITPTIILAIVLGIFILLTMFVILQAYKSDNKISFTGKAISEITGSAYNSIAKILGFVVEDTSEEKSKEIEEIIIEEKEEKKQEQAEEKTEKEQQKTEKQEEAEQPEEEQTFEEISEPIVEEQEEIINETEEQEQETNITIPETDLTNITETIENITEETNTTIPETNITIANETIIIPEITEESNITTNITIPEIITNITLANETIAKKITALNITTKQYKAVINRKVKWIKTFKVNKTENENLIFEIPKQATNITVKTGQEVQEAIDEIQDYEQGINQADREDIKEGITGYVSYDIESNKGILTKLWNWLTSLTITGNVIQENELQEEITEKQDTKEINLTNIIEQSEEQDEIGVEYYTEAPTSEETDISRGKQVIISGPDELNYTNILAYTILDNKVSINNSEKIKVYWLREEAEQTIEEEQITEEIEEPIEQTINETIGIEKNQTTEIINETEQPINNSSEEFNNLTDIENIIENKTKDKEEKQKEEKNNTKEKTSLITAFAVKDKEKKNKDNETEQLIDNSSEGLDNSINTDIIENKIIREEINFTAYDLDEDGMIDYIEWEVLHLSNQTYEIIYITKAEHLDENYTFIEDVYEEVKEKDDNWSKVIPNNNYVRVTFEQELDNTKDITIYARVKDDCSDSENNSIMINGTEVPCEIYKKKMRIDEIRRLIG
jgi:outer membrane biosynthesis protein TonB